MVYFPCRHKLLTRILFLLIGFFFAISFMRDIPAIISKGRGRTPSVLIDIHKHNDLENEEVHLPTSSRKGTISAEEEEEEWELDNENIPVLPVILGNSKNGPKAYSSKCAKFPDLYTVQFSNVHWQLQETRAEMYYFYSAYLDLRGKSSPHPHHPYDNALIRILGMSDTVRLNEKNATLKVCQFWFEHSPKPIFGNVTEVKMTWIYLWGNRAHYFPYLITCKLPAGLKELPVSVSLVPSMCTNATNNLNILHRDRANSSSMRIPQKNFGVCVKALDFPDANMRGRLIEWIETLRLLGADKIFSYEYFVDSEVKKVLDYYEHLGIIGVTQTTLPGELPNQPQLRHLYIRGRKLEKRLTELVPYNDCFYKNMYDYKYIAVMDTDEIIIPVDDITWSGLIDKVVNVDIGTEKFKEKPVTTFCFENFYFLDGMLDEKENEVSHLAPDFHMLRHVYRSSESTGKRYMKCFHSTQETLGVHNHFAFFCTEGKKCNRHYINASLAQMNHYRSTCVKEIKNCTVYLLDSVKDSKIWRFKDELIMRVETVLNNVNV